MIKETSSQEDLLSAEAKWDELKARADKLKAEAQQEWTKSDYERYKFEEDSKKPVD